MKVIMLADNKKVTVDDYYGARLIEQGKAVAVIEKEAPAEKPEQKAKKTGKE